MNTPGPWHTDGDCIHSAEGWIVASCHRFPNNDDTARPRNALLIAAAPELLALAHKYASECGECGGSRVVLTENGDGQIADEQCTDCAFIWAVIDRAMGAQP